MKDFLVKVILTEYFIPISVIIILFIVILIGIIIANIKDTRIQAYMESIDFVRVEIPDVYNVYSEDGKRGSFVRGDDIVYEDSLYQMKLSEVKEKYK